MDADGIVRVLAALGVEGTRIKPFKKNVSTPCPLAPWTHLKPGQKLGQGYDSSPSCTVEIVDGGPSRFKCWSSSCGRQGQFKQLVFEVWEALDKPGGDVIDLVDQVLLSERWSIDKELRETAELFAPGSKKIVIAGKIVDTAANEELEEVWADDELEEFKASEVPKAFFEIRPGLKRFDARLWEIGYDDYMHRMVIPVRRKDGKLVGLQGRATQKGQVPKYHNYWGFMKSKFLYGEHRLSKAGKALTGVILLEGPPDVWVLRRALRSHPTYRTMCPLGLFGTTLSDDQAERVLAKNVPIYVFFDGDESGLEGTRRVVRRLAGRVRVFVVKWLSNRIMYMPKKIVRALDAAEVFMEEVAHE